MDAVLWDGLKIVISLVGQAGARGQCRKKVRKMIGQADRVTTGDEENKRFSGHRNHFGALRGDKSNYRECFGL